MLVTFFCFLDIFFVWCNKTIQLRYTCVSTSVFLLFCCGAAPESFVLQIQEVHDVVVELGGRLAEDIQTQNVPNWPRVVQKLGAVPSHVKLISSASWNQRG